MNAQSLFNIIIPLTFLTFLVLSSCSKPAGTIGIGIQPEDSKLNLAYSDTATVYAYSSPMDSVRSDYLTWNGIGSLKDPVFGHTNVGFYTQFFLSSTGQYFGEGRQVDSLVLQLAYSGIFADTNIMLNVHVYEMAEGIDLTKPYYSNLDLQLYPQDYGNISFLSNPKDSVIIDSDTLRGVVRFNLSQNNPALAEKLLAASPDDMDEDSVFRDYFKGLFVIADPVDNGGSIAQFDLISPLSQMILYYQNDIDSVNSRAFRYGITSSAERVSKYVHDYTTGDPDFIQQVVNGDTALGAEKFYVQGFAGVKATIKFPHIGEFRKFGNVAVNEAKLVLPGHEESTLWGPPPLLGVYSINDDGSDAPLDDFNEGDTYFGGDYQKSTNSYTFRITRYVQLLISDSTKHNKGLALYVSKPWTTPNRFIFNGHATDSSNRIRLEILYTELD